MFVNGIDLSPNAAGTKRHSGPRGGRQVSSLVDGDYFIVSNAGEIDGDEYEVNDVAVYSSEANGFTRLSKNKVFKVLMGEQASLILKT